MLMLVAAWALIWTSGIDAPPAPPTQGRTTSQSQQPPIPIERTDDWLVQREPATLAFVVRDAKAAEGLATKLELDHLGLLDGEDLTALRRSVRDYRLIKERFAREYSQAMTAQSEESLNEEAKLLGLVEIAVAAEQAVEDGSYLVLEPPKSLLDVPDCDVFQTSARKDGHRVNVVVVMPYTKYPMLRQVSEYKNLMADAFMQAACDRFNALPDEKRRSVFGRFETLRQARQNGVAWTPADLVFMQSEMCWPLPLRIDRQRMLLTPIKFGDK